MEIYKKLLRVVFTDDPAVVRECRTCGTNLDPDHDACPTCESTGIVEYDLTHTPE